MPRMDECSKCGKEVQRSPSSAQVITCHACRRKHRECGTVSAYGAGCRCRPCKDAKAASMREYAARRKAEGRPLPRSQWRIYEDTQCECCGRTFQREKRNKRRYMKVFCSYLCRSYAHYGPRSSQLPKDHWALNIGATSAWIPPPPKGPFEFTCGWCETTQISDYPTTAYCDDTCRARARRARRRGREHGAHGDYTWGQVTRLWGQFNKACAYCRTPTPLADIQAEHVIPLSRGGANNLGNILPSCAPCNADKRDLSMDEWKADRERRNLPPVITHWQPRDPLYSHLTEANYRLAA